MVGSTMPQAGVAASQEARDALFGHLPPSLFAVLSSPAKRSYARMILAIYRRFFSEGYADVHRRDEIIAFIEAELDRNTEIVEDFAADAHNADVSQNPSTVYRKLVEGGWLIEHRQGYVTAVDLDASVSMLLETLSSIEDGEAVHSAGRLPPSKAWSRSCERRRWTEPRRSPTAPSARDGSSSISAPW